MLTIEVSHPRLIQLLQIINSNLNPRQVIPFLVLAVGVDNLFIMVHTYNRLDKTKYISISDGIGDALGQIGPSILLTSFSECCCFAIGSISDMPAVRTFALYATVAIFINFILQVSAFVALMSVDQQRYQVCRIEMHKL